MIDSLNPDLTFNPEWMVPIDENYESLKKGIIGETNIISGPSLVGKTGLVYWLRSQIPSSEIIKIDCMFHNSPSSFASTLVNELTKSLNIAKPGGNKQSSVKPKIKDPEEFSKKMVLDEEIKLHEIDRFIKDKPKQYIILIRHAEKLVEVKKQMLLYNLFEWMKTDIK